MDRGADLMYGSLDLLVLRTLLQGPAHGFGIASWLRQRTEGGLELDDAALYKALHRLERQDLVSGSWGITDNNRSARYYRLTGAGRAGLKARREAWQRWVAVMDAVLAPA